VDLNQAAVFRCFYAGWPVDKVEWLKNGQTLHLGHRWVRT
jgi:hypothetical protein